MMIMMMMMMMSRKRRRIRVRLVMMTMMGMMPDLVSRWHNLVIGKCITWKNQLKKVLPKKRLLGSGLLVMMVVVVIMVMMMMIMPSGFAKKTGSALLDRCHFEACSQEGPYEVHLAV